MIREEPGITQDRESERVARIVAELPPLTDEQCARVAALLRGSAA